MAADYSLMPADEYAISALQRGRRREEKKRGQEGKRRRRRRRKKKQWRDRFVDEAKTRQGIREFM